MSDSFSNHLTKETSLYLQQHSHNPVNWYPWSEEAWAKARRENKLVLVSIGYSSCHWCHVMEKETFTDTATARIMNENYVCIKVDREERPDIDQIYMSAVQLMTGSGGWPLNCFTLPDGRPIYGGTYFPKISWDDVLVKLKDFYKDNPDKAHVYATDLTSGIHQTNLISVKDINPSFSQFAINKAVEGWKPYFDNVEGGPLRTPKFPLPGNYKLLLRYAASSGDTQIFNHVKLTLEKMAYGGIYDQVAGGFARYSTDSSWKVPHFEKMLYDNAQLISLYASAYKLSQNDLYKKIALETLYFLKDEMSDGNGGYFSAIDADSDGEEGKFYIWTMDDFKNIKFPPCGKTDGFKILSDYYNINETGYWEKKNYILLRKDSDQDIARKYNLSLNELTDFISQARSILKKKRDERIHPSTDKKIITSWNALQISALCEAYESFGEEKFKEEAIKCARQILSNAVTDEGLLLHLGSQKNKMRAGYLEDYAFTISAFINLYQVTFDEKWIIQAKKFADDAISYFYDSKDGFFWYTTSFDHTLISRQKETTDNVIPSSNSEMANALFLLGDYFEQTKYTEIATNMLNAVQDNVIHFPFSNSNWAQLLMNYTSSFNEIIVTGEHAEEKRKDLSSNYLPNAIFAGSNLSKSTIPLLENRFQAGKTLIYICMNKTCRLPIENPAEAISFLKVSSEKLIDNVNYSK